MTKGKLNGTTRMPPMESKETEAPSPSEFIAESLASFEKKNNRRPHLILMSSDVMRDLHRELKLSGRIPKEVRPFSTSLMLREPITMYGIEVCLIGGTKRFALI